ncbi:hypothetical protein V1520DRAFT_368622 [Lipomyces starkeyi]|uniref:RING-type domain-containing protein n=1 Tax=Lipomyces starkeyi NRRL Y-11557 TaxID=675824 RepID=A0A1E3Q2A5_LIPST|nr:hypothetical protein LIPSTDRAFT_5178 [Lipomyces starkeyi NRRL Y-11557]
MSTKFNPNVPAFHPATNMASSTKLSLSTNASSFSTPSSPAVALPAGNDTLPKSASRKTGGTSSAVATPRNSQSQRPQHRSTRRSSHNPKPTINMSDGFPDSEGALAEQYLLTPSRNRRNQVSISHLLNFSLPPRESAAHRRHNPPSWQKHGSYSTDKAHFVNANFRFVVHPSGDYTVQALDPDVVIPWHLILQVLVSKHTQSSSCPICLTDNPVASRMARCGHIFCLPCLMRMLDSEMPSRTNGNDSGQPTKKRNICPLCLESLSLSDAKPVKWMDYPGDESGVPEAGKDVVLRLVMRKPGSILSLPRDGGERPSNLSDIPWHFAAEVKHYARIMRGTEDYFVEEFEREVRELEFMEQEDGAVFGEDGEWTHKAIERIFDTMEGIKGMGNVPKRSTHLSTPSERSRPRDETVLAEDDDLDKSVPEQYVSCSSYSSVPTISSSHSSLRSSTSSSRSRSTNIHQSSSNSSDAPYYFYQPRDATNCFLAPLDIRILKVAFGSFGAFPSTVLVRVERIISDQVVDDEFRKRNKYLAHLPAACPICILECDWTDVVKPEVLEQFAEDLEKRQKQRREKDVKEERARQKALKEEEESRYRNHHTVGSHSSGIDSSFRDAGIYDDFGNYERFPELLQDSPISDSSAWPTLSPLPSENLITPSASPVARTTVWGTPAVSFSRVGDALGVDDEPESTDDAWSTWVDDKLYEQIAAEDNTSSVPSSSGKKKKQKKKLVLMSTGGQWRA